MSGLVLTPLDLATAERILNGERVTDWHPAFPAAEDLEVAAAYRERLAYERDPHPFGPYLVGCDGVVVGGVGVTRGPDDDGVVEIGYGLVAAVRGRGLATDAVGQLLDRVRGLGVRAVVAVTAPGNVASQRVLAKLGFRVVDRTVEEVHHRLDLTPAEP
jgi:RimJ/RimL family protein N-acetyltransferase